MVFFFRGIAARGTLKPFFGQNVIDRSGPSSEEERGKKRGIIQIYWIAGSQ